MRNEQQTDFSKAIKFILDYKIHQGSLSVLLGINQGTFSDKIRGLRGAKFTPEQQEKIRGYLKKMQDDLAKLNKNTVYICIFLYKFVYLRYE